MAPKLVALPPEQCVREVKMCASHGCGHRGLDAADELLQAKLLLLLNRQMFVQGFDTENRTVILLLLLSDRHENAFSVTDSSGRTLPHNVYHLLRAGGM